ncbi:hypothetical protein B0H17DRAFT_1081924 [Mycena rosella]|uniref:Uncharacterized protein n=1 Tax=Mycena rosella TaxID=1033263 RepID=A0AAD7D1M5_MYCRO|nr:hypothetical protein B0H17DRAFT_1081924 [Mycena rosella]
MEHYVQLCKYSRFHKSVRVLIKWCCSFCAYFCLTLSRLCSTVRQQPVSHFC